MLVTVGTALIGATAIAFSLVVFAVQVNVTRLPHTLFRTLSRDWRILAYFGLTLTLSMTAALMSVFVQEGWYAVTSITAFW